MTNYTKKALVNVGKVFAISIVAGFFGYLVRIFFARNLSIEEFGLFYAIISFLSIFVIFITSGLDRALIFFIPKFLAESKSQNIKNSIVYAAAVSSASNLIFLILLFFFAGFLGRNYFHSSSASAVLMLMAVSFFIDGIVLIIQSSFQGFMMMATFSGIDLTRMILLLALSFVFFKLEMGIFSPVLAYIVTPLILISVYLPFLLIRNRDIFAKSKEPKVLGNLKTKEFSSNKLIWDKPLFKKLHKYGMQMVFLTVGAVILGHADRLMLTYYRSLEEVGIYSAVFPTAMMFSYIPFAIGKVLLPITSELWSRGLAAEFKKGVELLYRFFLIVMLPTSFLIFSFSDLLLGLFYGAAYIPGSFALKILAIGAIFFSLSNINGNILSGIGKPHIYTGIIILGTVTNVLLNITLIPKFGISGTAIATGLSFALMMIVGFYILVKRKLVELPYARWIKTLVISILFLFIVSYLNMHIAMNLFIKIPAILMISGLFYIAALFLSRLVTFAEIRELLKRMKSV